MNKFASGVDGAHRRRPSGSSQTTSNQSGPLAIQVSPSPPATNDRCGERGPERFPPPSGPNTPELVCFEGLFYGVVMGATAWAAIFTVILWLRG
jgi:hypothetical protein